ncbi:MAG: hypothetical protein EXR79_02320 [Myxococcales bacterium]|nr:hypothetical protein [Myxococcales bacterium]
MPARALALLLLGACASPMTGTSSPVVCKDPQTGACLACPGAKLCVDPVTCVPHECAKDIVFAATPKDGGATETAGLDTVADAGDGGAGLGDSAAPDAGLKDTPAGMDAIPIDAVGPLDVPAPDVPCAPGFKKCLGNTVQSCDTGTWKLESVCGTGLLCQDGACVCANPCPALNLVECMPGIPATRTCNLTPAGCLAWALPIACKPGESCQLGQCKAPPVPCEPVCGDAQVCAQGLCVAKACNPACAGGETCQLGQCKTPTTGTLGCGQITACVSGQCAPPADATCKLACVQKGTANAQAQFTTLQECVQATCKAFAAKPNEAMFCIYSQCGQAQAACLGAGPGDCAGLNTCLNDCANSPVCVNDCHAQASIAGGKDFYALMTCVDDKCAGLAGDAQVQCAGSQCKGAFDKCFGASAPKGLSCQQILQCAAGCGDKACAAACKQKGSPQGQAAITAMVACMDQKCGSFCAQQTPQCDTCLADWCGPQFAACN